MQENSWKSSGQTRIETRAPLTSEHKEYMLAHLMRLPALFGLARDELLPSHFSPEDQAYAVFWQAALNLSSRFDGRLPEEGTARRLALELSAIIAEDPVALSADQEEVLLGDGEETKGLLEWIYEIPGAELYEKDGTLFLQEFLHERTVAAPLKDYVAALGERTPLDLESVLRKTEDRAGFVASLTDSPGYLAFPPGGYKKKSLGIIPTSISFLDRFMDGGQAPSEVYFLFGPTGVGKTTLGIQIAYRGAALQHVLYRENAGQAPLGHWYYFTYEQGVDPDVQHRVWSHAARISINTFRKGEELSTSATLKPYERLMFESELKEGTQVSGEQERLYEQEVLLNPQNFRLFDMSGTRPELRNAGRGGFAEIERILANEQRNGRKIAGIVIDYALLMVRRSLSGRSKMDDKAIYHGLADFGNETRQRLAGQFGCAAWVLHQLSGAANKKSPTARQHHTDAALCTTMVDNAVFAFELGTKDLETSTCRIGCSKTRRSAGDSKEQIVIIDGLLSTMRDAGGRYALDYRSRRIVPSDMASKVVSGSAVDAAKKPRVDPAAALGMYRRSLDMSESAPRESAEPGKAENSENGD